MSSGSDRLKQCHLAILTTMIGIASAAPAFAELASLAQEPVGARMIVFVSGTSIASNEILFQYADRMDLKAIESLGKAHEGAVPFATMIPYLPSALAGWTAGEPQGMFMDMGTTSYSFATNEYTKDGADDDVTVIIWDTVNQQIGPWYAFWYGIISFETTEGYARSTTYKGYPAWEQRTYEDNSGGLAIGLSLAPVPEIGGAFWFVASLFVVYTAKRRMAIGK